MSINYGCLPQIVDHFQKQYSLLTNSFSLLKNSIKLISEVKGKEGEEIYSKMQNILGKNQGLQDNFNDS